MKLIIMCILASSLSACSGDPSLVIYQTNISHSKEVPYKELEEGLLFECMSHGFDKVTVVQVIQKYALFGANGSALNWHQESKKPNIEQIEETNTYESYHPLHTGYFLEGKGKCFLSNPKSNNQE